MITRNTDYSIQRLRGLSTDTKPTDVPNGSEFREMDTGKDFMYDEVSGDWKEQPKKGGGGGGGGVLNKLIDRSITAIAFDGNEIGPHAFQSCTNLSSISFPNATTVGADAFNGTAITEIVQTQFPKFRQSSSRTFASMQHLTRVFLPEVFIGQFGLSDCTKLKTAVIAGIVHTHVFSSSTLLEAADFLGVIMAIGLSVFYKTAISLLILRANTLIALATIDAFTNSPFASDGTGGTLYVPQALIADYQAATNWSAILSYPNNQILPIEGSIYETQYADGTTITTT